MAEKQLNRTVEVINPLLDKLDMLPSYPMNFKGSVSDPGELPDEATEGDCYRVLFYAGEEHNILNKLYYRKATTWEAIAVDSYTQYEIDTKFSKDEAALAEIIDSGAKNRLAVDELGLSQNPGTTYVHQGVTFVLNSDSTVTVTRTATGTDTAVCNLRYNGNAFYLNPYCTGDYIMSGCPAGGSLDTYYLEAVNSTGATEYRKADDGTGARLTSYTGDKNIIVRIKIDKNYSPDGLIFKPMVCSKAAWDITQAFVPNAMSAAEITAWIRAQS